MAFICSDWRFAVRRGVPRDFGANALQDAPSRAATTLRVIITSERQEA